MNGLELSRGLPARTLLALAELEARTREVDGGRLKLEWGVLTDRTGDEIDDLLYWEDDRLVGFVGLYPFGPPTVEMTGMVDPSHRRAGIATTLLDSALCVCRDRRFERVLLVVPRSSMAGHALAVARGGILEHSEHSLDLLGTPRDGPLDEQVSLRTAVATDLLPIAQLLTAAFGEPASDVRARFAAKGSRTLVVEVEGRAVGTVYLTHDDDVGGVYAFAVDPAWQGRGIGRDVLRRVCHQLRQEGAQRVHLEVAVDNDRALGLYTSIGFTQVSTEDYYFLPVPDGGVR